MYYVEAEAEIDAGHWLKLNYPSKCTSQHGHTFKIVVKCGCEELNEHGMVIDFTMIKSELQKLDHQVINKIDPFKEINPTAENLARVICEWINEKCELELNKPICYEVEVWETSHNKAVFRMDTK